MPNSPKTILITGANRGIGLECCRQFAHLGHRVILSARSAEKGEKAVEELAGENLKVEFLLLDTSDEKSILRAASELKQRIPALHVLINNAGILDTWQGSIMDATASELRDTYNTNVIGPVLLTQALVPLLEAGKPARVINVSSLLGSLQTMVDGLGGLWDIESRPQCRQPQARPRARAEGHQCPSPPRPAGCAPIWAGPGPRSRSNRARKNIVHLVTLTPPTTTNRFLFGKNEIPW